MTRNPHHLRRPLVRLALIFAVAQLVTVVGVSFRLADGVIAGPTPLLVLAIVAVDLVVLTVFASWFLRSSASGPMDRLAADVHRIADGDYHHRVGDMHRSELDGIRESVNRLADRLIANQKMLAENVASLERSNRELVEARDQVIRSARLASVGTLAAGIAHEVGNPLGAIMAFGDVAIGRARNNGGDTEILESIRNEARRIDRIVRGLLDYARPREGRSDPTAAAAVLERVRDLLESQGKLETVATFWEWDETEPHIVLEPHRLEQVLVNLLLNALHAVRSIEGARIRIRVFRETGEVMRLPRRREDDPPGIDYRHRRRGVRGEGGFDSVSTAEAVTAIEISDNGPGIAEADLERIFDPFFTTKEPGEGTGLGLSICARLIEGMGGRIDAENGPDGGARFTVRLPAVDEVALIAAEPPETA